ncbi:MAG: ABC transporter permease [Pseudomonadales bacterium]
MIDRNLLAYYSVSKLRAEVQRNYLSYVWWFLEPLFLIAAFYLVFEVMLRRGGDGFIYDLLVGVIVWSWFGSTVTQASTSILRATNLIQLIDVDKRLFPLVDVFVLSIKQLFVLLLLSLFVIFSNGIDWSWLWLPYLFLVQFLLIASLSLLVAASVPFIPDLHIIIALAIRFLMFCSGVFFTADSISEEHRDLFLLNPVANLIEQYRVVMLRMETPDVTALSVIALLSILLFVGLSYFMQKHSKAYPRLTMQ